MIVGIELVRQIVFLDHGQHGFSVAGGAAALDCRQRAACDIGSAGVAGGEPCHGFAQFAGICFVHTVVLVGGWCLSVKDFLASCARAAKEYVTICNCVGVCGWLGGGGASDGLPTREAIWDKALRYLWVFVGGGL